MLEKLRNFDPRGGIQLEDAVVLAATARQIVAEYDFLKIDRPGWIDAQVDRLRRFITDMVHDERKRKLAELRARHDQLKTPTERRSEIERQILELEALDK